MSNLRNSIYTQRINYFNAQVNKLKRITQRYTLARILTFFAVFIGFYVILEHSILWATISAIIFLSLFLFFVKKHIYSSRKLEYTGHLLSINQNELKVLEGDYSTFDQGNEYINNEHDYSFDLDIFGDGSLFQYLNRSSIKSGAKLLAKQLQYLIKDHSIIKQRQDAIQELSEKIDWRHNFIATGKMAEKSDSDIEKLDEWLDKPPFFKNKTITAFLLIIISFITSILIILSIIKILPYSTIGLTFIYQAAIYTFFAARINTYHAQISRYSKTLNNYAQLMLLVENDEWNAELSKKLSNSLQDRRIASKETKRLSELVGAFDTRMNLLLGFVFNWVLMWDMQCILRIEKWKDKNEKLIKTWFNVLDEMDALQSFANYRYNNPDYTFPETTEKSFVLHAKSLGHPLIFYKERICNDFRMEEPGRFSIITGANMAGKSTFLRTVGVNLILAMNGAPVCASEFLFTPINVFSSMRTDDSLQRHKSYFFSELERLKTIFDKINRGEQLFLILDEILKGTNSKDKEIGSKAFMKKLIGFKANGIIATHDLSLGELEKEFPENIINQCFEVKISEKELDFDYKLYTGITKNLNASYLMKKMGIV
jgi:DNA mismatch repair ATPase MutS